MTKVRDFTLNSDGSYQLVRTCYNRESARVQPKNITASVDKYLPFDHRNQQTFNVSNMLGMRIPSFTIKSGEVYDAFDGKRVIYEVGCNSVIYLLVKPGSPDTYNFFIQEMDQFVFDVTSRSVAAKVATITAPIVTIIKYEMYFMLGLISTVNLPTLIIVTGSDMLVAGLSIRRKFQAAARLSRDLLEEQAVLASYAPTLHGKLEEFFFSQASVRWKDHGRQLPVTVASDEQTQAQLAGALAGQATVSPKPFTAWAAVFTILSTAAIKSVTKSPETYGKNLNSRYSPLLNDLGRLDWDDPMTAVEAARKIEYILSESGITVSRQEADQIFGEIVNNPGRILSSINNVSESFDDFLLVYLD